MWKPDFGKSSSTSKCPVGTKKHNSPQKSPRKLAQLEDHLDHVEKQLAKEREEFAKTLGATRLRTYEKEKTFEAQIARLKKPDLPGCDERRIP